MLGHPTCSPQPTLGAAAESALTCRQPPRSLPTGVLWPWGWGDLPGLSTPSASRGGRSGYLPRCPHPLLGSPDAQSSRGAEPQRPPCTVALPSQPQRPTPSQCFLGSASQANCLLRVSSVSRLCPQPAGFLPSSLQPLFRAPTQHACYTLIASHFLSASTFALCSLFYSGQPE